LRCGDDRSRAASSNPWIFRQIQQYLDTGRYDEASQQDRYDMMRQYYGMLIAQRGARFVGKMKQFATYFTHGVRHGAPTARVDLQGAGQPRRFSICWTSSSRRSRLVQ